MVAPLLRWQSAVRALVLVLLLGGVAAAQDTTRSNAILRTAGALVRPGDKVALHFLRDKDMSTEVLVDERGMATFPKVGTLHVSRFAIRELQDTLRARYAEYLRAPELEVIVLRRIVVNGEVRIPNVYLVDGSATVREAIAMAGGITETGSRGKVAIIREGRRLPVKDWDVEQGPAADLLSGDQVFVGRKSWLTLNALPVISTAVLVSSFVIAQLK